MTNHAHLLKKSVQRSKKPARNVDEMGEAPLGLHNTESMSPQNILHLQRTIGNAATQRVLTRTPASGATLQRRLDFAPEQLAGKTAKTGIKKLFDNPLASTFREIEEALANFHKTARDDTLKLKEYLTTIVEKCDHWLGNRDHQKQADEAKYESLKALREMAWVERRRVIITKELGVPYQIVDALDAAKIDGLWKIVVALDAKKPQEALAHFDAYQSYLGDSALLVKQFMMRNQMQVFNPQLAGILNTDNFKLDPKKGAGAKQLIVNEARAKLAEFTRLNALYEAQDRAYQEEKKKNPDTKMTDYPLLTPTTPEGDTYMRLKTLKPQFEGIANGVTVPQTQKKEGMQGLTENELYGIVGYTSDLFTTINTGMRYNTADKTKFTNDHAELAGAMTSGLNKLKPYKGRVFRHNGDFPAFKAVNVQDATVVEIAPMSTAVSQMACASAGQNHAVLEVFESINGKNISKASVFGEREQEVMFAPGSRFKVIGAFARRQSAWNTPHHESQYDIHDQKKHPLFAEAMKVAAEDSRNKDFHRIIFKTEIK